MSEDFGAWLGNITKVLDRDGESDVPCGGCTACCRASQFVHVEPDELETRARIPRTLLFPAPNAPAGHHVMGYDERGRCPMLVDDRCSIYGVRPRACRAYDCRVFAATDVFPDEPEKGEVATRARAWTFTYAADVDRRSHQRLAAVAAAMRDEAGSVPGSTATHVAIGAIMRFVASESEPGRDS
ncbi:MAG: YkgJ family cysteine cluster protein [Acidimicrobiia bacterium]